MRIHFIVSTILFIILIKIAQSSPLDEKLKAYIDQFNYQAIDSGNKEVDANLYKLGRMLFFDRKLSHNNNISCHDCHLPRLGSSDGLPFSIGEGAQGLGSNRVQGPAQVVRRNSPALFNKGEPEYTKLFHDGRVEYNSRLRSFRTPYEGINGRRAEHQDIAKTLSGALAAQALFPLVDKKEMRGVEAPELDEKLIWDEIVKKLLQFEEYQNLLETIYPKVEKINIAHFTNALAYFITEAFRVDDTPWDSYLRGDLSALSDQEKRGAIIFSEKAKCSSCHDNKHLSNFNFTNIGIVDIGVGEKSIDLGRYQATGKENDKFKFAVPSLRNIALSAPYFHNGSAATIDDVIDHYLDPVTNFQNYDLSKLSSFQKSYNLPFYVLKPNEILTSLDSALPLEVSLTEEEKEDLKVFLMRSLTSPRWY